MPPVNSVGNINPQQQQQQSAAHLTYMGSQGTRQSKTASGVRPQPWKGSGSNAGGQYLVDVV